MLILLIFQIYQENLPIVQQLSLLSMIPHNPFLGNNHRLTFIQNYNCHMSISSRQTNKQSNQNSRQMRQLKQSNPFNRKINIISKRPTIQSLSAPKYIYKSPTKNIPKIEQWKYLSQVEQRHNLKTYGSQSLRYYPLQQRLSPNAEYYRPNTKDNKNGLSEEYRYNQPTNIECKLSNKGYIVENKENKENTPNTKGRLSKQISKKGLNPIKQINQQTSKENRFLESRYTDSVVDKNERHYRKIIVNPKKQFLSNGFSSNGCSINGFSSNGFSSNGCQGFRNSQLIKFKNIRNPQDYSSSVGSVQEGEYPLTLHLNNSLYFKITK